MNIFAQKTQFVPYENSSLNVNNKKLQFTASNITHFKLNKS